MRHPGQLPPDRAGLRLVLHSATKYLNGHSDIVAGAVVGKAERIVEVKHKLDHLGGALDAHACFLLQRGLKTLALRVRHQNESALQVARFLESHPAVARVNYPGLDSHPRPCAPASGSTAPAGCSASSCGAGSRPPERFFATAHPDRRSEPRRSRDADDPTGDDVSRGHAARASGARGSPTR